jgi:hypothetical protein
LGSALGGIPEPFDQLRLGFTKLGLSLLDGEAPLSGELSMFFSSGLMNY